MINYIYLGKLYTFDTFLPYHCNINCLYLLHQHFINSKHSLINFSISYCPKSQEIKNMPNYQALLV